MAFSGRLVFYRWPMIDACWSDAPVSLQNVATRCPCDAVPLTIHLGHDRGHGRADSPEAGTACTVYNLFAATEEEAAVAAAALSCVLHACPLPCRPDGQGKPRSAVAWVEGGAPLERPGARVVELADLVEHGEHGLLDALRSMIDVMMPHLQSHSAKRRRKDDVLQVARALQQLQAVRVPPSNALFRQVLPLMSPAMLAEQPAPPARSFAAALLATESERRTAPLRHGLGNPQQALQAAISLVLAELSVEAGAALRGRQAQCPWTGYLQPFPKPRTARTQ